MTRDTLTLTLTGRRALSARVVELTLSARDQKSLPKAPAGSHLEVTLPDGLVRHYSLLDDGANGSYRIGVLREQHSRGGSAFLTDPQSDGTRLTTSLPLDRFPLDEGGKRQILIGGGIGITPIVAMARQLYRQGVTPEVHYLVRHADDAAFAEELGTLLPENTLRLHVSSQQGRIALAALIGTVDADTRIHACGPESLLAALEDTAREWPDGCLRLERFRGVAADDTPRDGHCHVVLQRTGKDFTLAPDESLLDGLHRVGAAPPTLCGEGACGTCACGVLEGNVDHRDVLQSDGEKAANTTLYACVSRPAGDRLVLDV